MTVLTNPDKKNKTEALDFLIIGTMKGGTTSVYNYLKNNPAIDLCIQKEVNFFNNDINWPLGIVWYAKYFANDGRIKGDVNPNYAMYPLCQEVPARIHQVAPSAKIIYLVRDPVDRIISHLRHYINMGKEKRSLAQIFSDLHEGKDPFGYVSNSKYYYQISEFRKYFSDDQILIIKSEDFRKHRNDALKRLYRFVGVSVDAIEMEACQTEHHVSSRRRRWPAIIESLFKHDKLGRWIHLCVLNFKRLLPAKMYEFSRKMLSSDPVDVVLTKNQKKELREMLQDDHELFECYTRSR